MNLLVILLHFPSTSLVPKYFETHYCNINWFHFWKKKATVSRIRAFNQKWNFHPIISHPFVVLSNTLFLHDQKITNNVRQDTAWSLAQQSSQPSWHHPLAWNEQTSLSTDKHQIIRFCTFLALNQICCELMCLLIWKTDSPLCCIYKFIVIKCQRNQTLK